MDVLIMAALIPNFFVPGDSVPTPSVVITPI
jgi:hypothetical protein